MRRTIRIGRSASVGPVRVATFNLLHGQSLTDGRADEAALRAAANTLGGDVVGLQEVDRGQPRSHLVDQTAAVADALEARHWRFAPALHGTPGSDAGWTTADDGDDVDNDSETASDGPMYGVGLVSRLPVQSWHVRRFRPAPIGMPLMVPGSRGLTHVRDEPRVAVAAVLDSPVGPLTVVTAHLSFMPGWNIAQLRTLARWACTFPGPRLLFGDLNLPGTLPRTTTRWAQLARTATYPSWRPRVQFDHVLADGIDLSAVRDVQVMRLGVSDHCALAVDLDLG
jgi:endonuclease/exonuclease/phosphatase family metal-dependent hydrolase